MLILTIQLVATDRQLMIKSWTENLQSHAWN